VEYISGEIFSSQKMRFFILRGLIYEQVFFPEHAPKEWSDRSVLWNTVEEVEKTKDSRISRELVIALAVGAIADALEVARVELICLKYRERRLNIAHTTGTYRFEYDKECLKAYHTFTEQIEQKTSEAASMSRKPNRTSIYTSPASATLTASALTGNLHKIK